jgi:enoyl-CoA hydratase/carnithine racemase
VTRSENKGTFSAGLNLKLFKGDYDDLVDVIQGISRVFGRVMSLNAPSVCLLNGHALAGGFMLAMSHDYRLCVDSNSVKLGMTEINLGMTIPLPMLAPL